MVTVPCRPYVMSVMPGTCPVIWVNCFGVTAPNWPSSAMFQSWPYRLGVPTRRSRFAPNVPAPATAATATARPSMALRTGTLARPVPGSSANRTPMAAASGAPARDRRSASSGRRRDGSASVRGGARPGLPPRGHRDAGGEQHHDRGRPGGEDADVHADAGIRFGEPGGADRGQRGRGDRDRDRAEGAGDRGGGRLRHARGEQLAAGHAERRQRAVVLGGGLQRPGRDLADDEQRGERQGEPEQRKGDRLRADQPLDGRRLRRLVGGEHLAAGARVPAWPGSPRPR